MKPIKIIIADDHAIVRDGIRSTLSEERNFKIIGEASNGIEAVELVKLIGPDILLIDITMPEMNGLEAVEVVSKKYPETRCVIFSMHDKEEYVLQSLEAGAFGYLLKDTGREEIIRAINTVSKGGRHFTGAVSEVLISSYLKKVNQDVDVQPYKDETNTLTKRERGILKFIVEGMNNREIAEKLNISIRTIETHRSNMMRKVNARNAIDLVKIAISDNLV
ncbi:response regulator transcription factor [Cytophagaceae bacterium ABcell3]|nr:response regulator transcription factor [Cytophagaceae bacterium ABcell3]